MPAPDTTTWLKVEVDEDGNMTVHDLVEGTKSEPIPTVNTPPRIWADNIHAAIMQLLLHAGMDTDS